jgi:hypothetical protein
LLLLENQYKSIDKNVNLFFKQWLIKEGATPVSKTGLYPLAHIGNYPPQYFIPSGADAIYYMSIDPRFKGVLKSGEGEPFSIKHI